MESIDEFSERLEGTGGLLKFSGLGPGCRKIFELTRFDRRFDLFDSLIDAVRSFH